MTGSSLRGCDIIGCVCYLQVSSVGGAQESHSAPVNRSHSDGGEQSVGELPVPELQPLHKLGHLQTVLPLAALVDALVEVTVVRRGLGEERRVGERQRRTTEGEIKAVHREKNRGDSRNNLREENQREILGAYQRRKTLDMCDKKK